MTNTDYYHNSNHINVHLTSKDKAFQCLTDELLTEISIIKEIKKKDRPKVRESLKKALINILHNELTSDWVRYSRNKNDYCLHRMYHRLWFKYKWFIEIVIDGLIELGYVEHLNGCWNKEKNRGLQSKMRASDKLRPRLSGMENIIERDEPEQIIQLKDRKKNLIQYTGLRSINKMRERLAQYNNFIREQYITVNLPAPVMTDNEFWINNLLRGLLDGRFTLDSLTLNQEINPDRVADKVNTMVNNYDREDSSYPSPSISTSSILNPTFINTTSTPSSTILTPNNLISHIQLLIHLYSTKENQPNRLVDKAISVSDEQLLDYFLNWLIFLNRDIKSVKDEQEKRQLCRIRGSLGDLGIEELVFRLKYESLHRVFNRESFKKGGRFFGASHLDIQGHMRSFIKINGEPVIELDYDALHVVMLYHRRGLDINLDLDPYDMIVGSEDRAIKKKAFLTAINAPSDAKAIKGIRKELVDDGINGEILTDKSIKSLLARAKLAHPLIADDIGSGKGIVLQNIDSKIADAILTNLMAENIPTLPVHDSFIVPQQYEDKLRQYMEDEYEKVLKFKPGVSKKGEAVHSEEVVELSSLSG